DGMHMLAHHSQTRQLPEQVGHLLDNARAAVLDGQDRRIDRAHLERLKGQSEGRVAGRLRVGKDRRDRLVRVGAGLSLVGDLHPKIMCRMASATWLWSWSWSVTGGGPVPSLPLGPFASALSANLARRCLGSSFL